MIWKWKWIRTRGDAHVEEGQLEALALFIYYLYGKVESCLCPSAFCDWLIKIITTLRLAFFFNPVKP